MTDLFDSLGNRIPLGKQIGGGGEGTVHEVPSIGPDFLAKLYHKPISEEKQAKLEAMVAHCHEDLRKFTAWPIKTLRGSMRGPVCGFLMTKAEGREIHELYGPASRKQHFPKRDWAFLVNVARNLAVAFSAIHAFGHVVADVNPRQIFVANNSLVRLIDCDSFQVGANGKHYLCEVGFLEFTPPEIQKYSSFRHIRRSPNHDNFGLALMIFHILLMGRHPFSGRYMGQGDMPIPKAIEELRYAFGLNATNRQMAPLPNCLTPAILPPAIIGLFERAFNQQGSLSDERPTARNWVVALDALKQQLRVCAKQSSHKYFLGLSNCPWCEHESKTGSSFFPEIASQKHSQNSAQALDINDLWSKVKLIQSPGVLARIDPLNFRVTPTPIPPELTWFFGFLKSEQKKQERNKRQQAYDSAKQEFANLSAQWEMVRSDEPFEAYLRQFTAKINDYIGLEDWYKNEKNLMENNARSSQLLSYLTQFPIEKASIPGIGPALKRSLTSSSIYTAADLNAARVSRINGFGPQKTKDIIAWRNRLSAQFRFDPSKGISQTARSDIDSRYYSRRTEIENFLTAAPVTLNKVREDILQKRATLQPLILKAGQKLAQTKADLDLMK